MEVDCKERKSRLASCVPDLETSHILIRVNKLVTEMEVDCKPKIFRPVSCVPDLEASHILIRVNKLMTESFWPRVQYDDAFDAFLDDMAMVDALRRPCFVDSNFVPSACKSVRAVINSGLKDEDFFEILLDDVALADALRRPRSDDTDLDPREGNSTRFGAVNSDLDSPQKNDCQSEFGCSDDDSADIYDYLFGEGTLVRLPEIERQIKGDFVLGVILLSDTFHGCYDVKILWTGHVASVAVRHVDELADVFLDGLLTRCDLNGQHVYVLDYILSTNRVQVVLDNGTRIQIKPECLQFTQEQMTTYLIRRYSGRDVGVTYLY